LTDGYSHERTYCNMKTAQVAVVLLALVLCMGLTQSANILAIFSYTFISPYLVGQPYIKGLIDKGHNVTIISPVRFLPDIKGARHIRVSALDEVIDSKYLYTHVGRLAYL